jgi:hypothetical protein
MRALSIIFLSPFPHLSNAFNAFEAASVRFSTLLSLPAPLSSVLSTSQADFPPLFQKQSRLFASFDSNVKSEVLLVLSASFRF